MKLSTPTSIFRTYAKLRYRLLPYIYSQAYASTQGAPPMRPLLFDFPDDEVAVAVEDEYMFGPDLLVAPIPEAGARKRGVYLPAGAAWTDAWSGAVFDGGRWIAAEAPLERIPLYLRDGAELPIRA